MLYKDFLVPRQLYKFMEPKYLKMLRKDKCFYINHLNNYKEEELGSAIGDNNEGKLTTEFHIENYTFNNNKSENAAFEYAFYNLQNGIKIGEGCTNIKIKNVSIVTEYKDDNYYVYCLCNEYDEKVKKEFGGSALIIERFPEFLSCINLQLKKKGIEMVLANTCQYVPDRKKIFSENDKIFFFNFPFLVKELRYAYQKEYRIIWRSINNKRIVKPLLIKCPEALEYCKFEF